MKNIFIFTKAKCFLYGCIILILALQLLPGCGGSDEVELTKRDKDSLAVYADLQKSFALYKKALTLNESGDTKSAAQYFEMSLESLNKIDYELVMKSENYYWKKDYQELSRSIVEDYFVTQSEISQSSLVFEFAKRIPLHYERVEEISGDREPLPDGSEIPLIKNSAVEQYIEFFSNTERGRSFIDKCLYRSGKFFPIMRKILKYNNAPEELIYLSVQESGLSPTIVSRAGAVGLWQFMPATGYSYGLDQDGYRDDRRDFEKSTDAAARHLKDLYRTFDDWYLAFSAYNAGPGRVRSAINKSGSRDFWSLRGYLPGETKNYVPSIIALSFVLRNPEEYGFKDIEYGTPLAFDRVNIQSELSLQKIADLCESDIETIRELNSELTSDIAPAYDVPYQIRIPHKSFEKFLANYENASDIDKAGNFTPQFAGNETEGSPGVDLTYYKVENYEPEDVFKIASTEGKKKVVHEFKKKEQLDVIAVYYSVRPTDIRIWNNIGYGNILKSKQKLDIYVSEDKYKLLNGLDDGSDVQTKLVSENNDSRTIPLYHSENTKKENSGSISENSNEEIAEDINENSNETFAKETENNSSENSEVKSNSLSVNTLGMQADNSETENDSEEYSENSEDEVDAAVKTDNSNKVYVVAEGDNLSAIANKFAVSVTDIKQWNHLDNDKIIIGQKLILGPAGKKAKFHIVEEGESLSSIAKENGVTVSELKELNALKTDVIFSGQKLKLN